MSQLIKLDNYISRYERDIFHYPSQFSRLKTENWQRLKQLWQDQVLHNVTTTEMEQEASQASYFTKWRSFFNSRSDMEEESDEIEVLPETEEALKQYFLDALFPFQLKWASTTIDQMSFIDNTYKQDFLLKYFLQRIPDTHLLLYRPVFRLKNGPIEGEIILISPLEIEIITLIEKPSTQRIITGDSRTWYLEEFHIQSKALSPMIAAKRTETIIHSILKKYQLDFPVKKVILSRTNIMDFQTEPYRTKFVDANQHENWLKQKQTLYTPLKHQQLKVAEALLKHGDSIAVPRPEWQQQESTQIL
ncbi:NERD domain-containing protein [Gracilibacillus salinarum]|uniref:NERD domain-containing protein n=1 Tax=Gracilibacillus salinarum TaxID=2932255 RepID=A0ABY4GPL4_9BACI|nr:NERD domain-containing protein [Gracilibacillus salinarum]UOQ86336.1 NERD domain-containing protein [Gracilibacillus salinarum]